MQQSGEHFIAAPVARVWEALNDPAVLQACIEGCERLDRTADNAFSATIRARIGPVSAVFTGEVTLSDLDPPQAYTLTANAKGGPAGFGKGVAHVKLVEADAGTRLSYDVEGSVGGKLAQVGQRLIDGAARKMADDFFVAFAEAVAAAAPSSDTQTEAVRSAPAPSTGVSRGAMFWIMLVGALVVAVVTVIWLSR